MSVETVKKYFKGEKDSAFIDTKDLQRKIFILNDLAGINAVGTYEQGKKEGESNFKVAIEDTPFFKGEVAAANYGSKSTGSNQALINASLNNISGIGDLFAVNGSALYINSFSVLISSDVHAEFSCLASFILDNSVVYI